MKTNRHSLMAKGVMVLLTLLILVFIFTYAWFIGGDAPAIANGLSVSTSSSVDFDVAIGFCTPDTGGNYYVTDFRSAEDFDFEDLTIPTEVVVDENTTIVNPITASIEHFNLLKSFKPIDLTGNGVRIYRPSMMPKNVTIRYDDTSVDYDVTENKQYISFDLYVRSQNSEMHVSLDTGSYVVGACEIDDAPIKVLANEIADGDVTVQRDTNDGGLLKTYIAYRNAEGYGDFSEDSVVGAVRIAFAQYTYTSMNLSTYFTRPGASGNYLLDDSRLKLWIPRPDIYLQDSDPNADPPEDWELITKSDGDDFQGNASFYVDPVMQAVYAGNGQSITYENAAKKFVYYDDTKIRSYDTEHAYQRFTTKEAITDLETDNTAIIELDPNLEGTIGQDTFYYGKCRVNLWIEGCDAEARKAIDGGSFLFGFDLKGEI